MWGWTPGPSLRSATDSVSIEFVHAHAVKFESGQEVRLVLSARQFHFS